ncbi:3548_t:CDS:2, partial [Racocetra fulgida]
MTQVAAEMAWEERLENSEKICKTITINHFTSPANKSNIELSSASKSNVESSLANVDPNLANKSNIESIPTNESSIGSSSELNDSNILGQREIEIEELGAVTSNTTDLHNCHPAEHKDSKIELKFLFANDLLQPSFVRALQQCVEDNSTVPN